MVDRQKSNGSKTLISVAPIIISLAAIIVAVTAAYYSLDARVMVIEQRNKAFSRTVETIKTDFKDMNKSINAMAHKQIRILTILEKLDR